MIRAPYIALLLLWLIGCGTAKEVDKPSEFSIPEDTIEVSTPTGEYQEGRVYIHEVKKLSVNGVPKFVLEGSLPESCSRLLSADLHFVSEDLVKLQMASWRPADAMCLQVLVDFTYVFNDIDDERMETVSVYEHDGEQGEIVK